jgi:hypothetical protein
MESTISDTEKASGQAVALWRAELKLRSMSILLNGYDGCNEDAGSAYRGLSLILDEIVERVTWVRESIEGIGKGVVSEKSKSDDS